MKKKVVVAMSGGVDSSVAAALLLKEGMDVIGITLKLFRNSVSCCGSDETLESARRVCEKLGIRHYFQDASPLFSEKVIGNFKSEYMAGRTPNPCIECNRHLKFDYLFSLAASMGADALATGHYAIVEKNEGEWMLKRGADPGKDQSYFLYPAGRNILPRLLFPMGRMKKTETRKTAFEMGLPCAKAPESKDICFISGSGYGRYVCEKPEKGRIVDTAGKLLGYHDGFFNFTLGQRKGLGIAAPERLYVVEINPGRNEIVLGEHSEAFFSEILIENLNWLVPAPPREGDIVSVQIRYRHKPCKCRILLSSGGKMAARFSEPQFAPARGQSAVFYENDRVLGGGIIKDVQK